jgi:hypothetical protein
VTQDSLDQFLARQPHAEPSPAWTLQKTLGGKGTKRRGRTPGSGSYERADEPYLEEMHNKIESGSAKSPEDAAKTVAANAEGGGTEASKVTRLAKRYRKRFGSGPR